MRTFLTVLIAAVVAAVVSFVCCWLYKTKVIDKLLPEAPGEEQEDPTEEGEDETPADEDEKTAVASRWLFEVRA